MLLQRAYYTAIGRKQANQDSLLYLKATMAGRTVSLAAVCDGMGGLAKGELASAQVITALEEWFTKALPPLVDREDFEERIHASWNDLIDRQNSILVRYGKRAGISLGTTIAVLLLVDENYYIVNVGDSRVYSVTDSQIQIMTKDQTLVMQEVEKGNLRYEDMEKDPRRNVLLQCVGVSDTVFPEYYMGKVSEPTVFVICSDGFRHLIGPGEMQNRLQPLRQADEGTLSENLSGIGRDVFVRGEHDNITAVAVCMR